MRISKVMKVVAMVMVACVLLLMIFPTVYAQELEIPTQLVAMGLEAQNRFWTSGESATISQIIFSCAVIGIGFILVDRLDLEVE